MGDTSRIDDLRRRVEKDPASIAFAQLAEEHRRAGDHEEAVRVCRAGLERHPLYLSARVTLGRALLELARYDEAQAEFEHVLLAAPDNLVALRSLAELHQRRETAPADPDPDPNATIVLPPAPTSLEVAPTEFEVAPTEFEVAPTRLDVAPTRVQSRALEELESWLRAIEADRVARARG